MKSCVFTGGALAEGFEERLKEFQNFERTFEASLMFRMSNLVLIADRELCYHLYSIQEEMWMTDCVYSKRWVKCFAAVSTTWRCSWDVFCIDMMEFGLWTAVFVSPEVYFDSSSVSESAPTVNAFILQSVSSLLKSRFTEARTRFILSSVLYCVSPSFLIVLYFIWLCSAHNHRLFLIPFVFYCHVTVSWFLRSCWRSGGSDMLQFYSFVEPFSFPTAARLNLKLRSVSHVSAQTSQLKLWDVWNSTVVSLNGSAHSSVRVCVWPRRSVSRIQQWKQSLNSTRKQPRISQKLSKTSWIKSTSAPLRRGAYTSLFTLLQDSSSWADIFHHM